jgi:hypothetical protein
MQRAAEAGALAGVLYMPSYYNIVRPGDVDSAVSRASKEIVMNGFGSVLSPTTLACVSGAAISICAVTGKSADLTVTITQTLDLVLLSGLGVQPVTLSATAQAEYLPPGYTGNCQAGTSGTGWWQMIYASANGTPGDQVGVKFSLTGSPIHLLEWS